jgi:hypothetical protein
MAPLVEFDGEGYWRPAGGVVMISRNGGLPMNYSLVPSAAAALALGFLSLFQTPVAAQTPSPSQVYLWESLDAAAHSRWAAGPPGILE